MEPATQTSGITPMASGSAANPDLSGKALGEFQLLRRLGLGGMGQVYLAEQVSLKRKVAIKVMRTDVAVSMSSYQRFRAEAEAIARVTHANIVQVYAFGEQDGLHYMALEYVEGRNLRQYLSKKGPPDLPLALSIMRQVAAALQRASELGIVHRDIKPENILLTRRGEVKVADFGLSRCFDSEQTPVHITQPGVTMGTPLYMSPEQVQGKPVDPRSDIYSFGVTCYHMLAGTPPFRGQTALELAMQHVQEEPRPLGEVRPDLPVEFCAVIHKMMAKEVENRYQSCAELRKDLDRFRGSFANLKTQVSGSAALARATSGSASVSLRTRRPWFPALVASTILLALAGGGATAWFRNRGHAAPLPHAGEGESVVPELSDQEKQERFLREAVAQYANPNGDRGKLEIGLGHNIELAVFYLRHNRLDQAEAFFSGLVDNPNKVAAYQTLGRLGQAMVLAYRDQAEQSNRKFLACLQTASSNKPAERLPFLLRNPSLRFEIGRALEHNKANATKAQPFPPGLEAFRLPHSLSPP
jgi:serine/threonine-protein kinase